ncbi:GPP34 family phosphoprotein [Streptomyces sp. PSKA54]|uniref:GPP34 family phosphoprotein n=1 Tax=Streptomyces himalayensis subsp. aureolus TaxID=2758039 RepID=A0A7W2D1V3_9ACTN|nr:GPP34 family phosphoprotein [Streptomyces himalayensis]MBA4863081.1 GPP34 family phosphoprotein [Streptomyces himalayensis subsp. aureolus]
MNTDATSSLPGDFMLAVYLDGQGRVPGYRAGLDYGLSAAMLIELALDGFIHIVDGYIVAVHGAEPRDPVLREVLVRIRSSRKRRRASEWVRALSVSAHKRLSAGLIADGVLVRTPRRLPLPTRSARRYDVLRGERRDAAVRSLGDAADSSHRSVALAALASACGDTSGGREWSESEATLRSLSPTCAPILTAVADCVRPLAFPSWD